MRGGHASVGQGQNQMTEQERGREGEGRGAALSSAMEAGGEKPLWGRWASCR